MKVREREWDEVVVAELSEAAPAEEEDVAGEGAVSAGTGALGAEGREDANVEDLDLVEADIRAGAGERSSSSSELV